MRSYLEGFLQFLWTADGDFIVLIVNIFHHDALLIGIHFELGTKHKNLSTKEVKLRAQLINYDNEHISNLHARNSHHD